MLFRSYYYYVTQMREQEFWRLVKVDFTRNQSIGKLVGRLGLMNKAGDLEFYQVEAAVREGALIVVFDPEIRTIEPVMTSVFPVREVTGPYFGILYLMTWDHTYAFSPCLISRKPLFDWATEQDPAPSEIADKLDSLWGREFDQSNKVLQRVNRCAP